MRKEHGYANPAAEKAIGNAHKEWRQMAKLALRIRNNTCPPIWAAEQERKFIGIYQRLLTDPIEEVEREAR